MSAFTTAQFRSAFEHGEMELKGQFMLGSNHTFLVIVHHEGLEFPAVYKPTRGEQPLWDFPSNTLARREVAAYLVSEALGWSFVPFTALMEKGPHGPGSIQQFIEYDPNYHYFSFSHSDKDRLPPVALFDLLVNNADRKGSHVLIEQGTDKLWLIDHGLCFHEEDKLRTVIWDFAGQPIPEELLEPLAALCTLISGTSSLRTDLARYLGPNEITALSTRAQALIAAAVFPQPPADRRAFPYPPV